MKKSIVRLGLTAVTTVALAFGLTACGGSGDGEGSAEGVDDPGTSEEVPAEESAEFIGYVNEAVQIVNDKIANEDQPMQQIMLANDVDQPTQKYGMWVMPFAPDQAVVEKFISTIQIENGTDFQVELTSAATGKVWTMDQAGTLAEASE